MPVYQVSAVAYISDMPVNVYEDYERAVRTDEKRLEQVVAEARVSRHRGEPGRP